MLSPNRIANSMTGMKETIGTPLSAPIRLAPMPSWKGFAERLRTRPPGETAFDAMRTWIIMRIPDLALDSAEQRRRALIRATLALRAHERSNLARFEALLAAGVAADLDVSPDSLRAHLVSAAAVAALHALGSSDDDAVRSAEHAVAVMDEALVFLRGGLDALRPHPPI